MELEVDPTEVIQGTCQTMCPLAELRLRERESLLHFFEISPEDRKTRRKPKADPRRAVKAYSRPAAGRVNPSPADVRPAPVLLTTVQYLFENIVPSTDTDWVHAYDFVVDRLRAVRQDAVLQALHGPPLVQMLERIVRFHVYAGYRLCEHPLDQYDPVLNDQHLLECLKQLLRLYSRGPKDQEQRGGPTGIEALRITDDAENGEDPGALRRCNSGENAEGQQGRRGGIEVLYDSRAEDRREEFEALYLLHNLGSAESLRHGLSLPLSVRNSPLVKQALEVNMAFLQGNYIRFFRRALRLPSPLCLCALHRHFHHIRVQALRVMSVAYSSKACQFPIATLSRVLHTQSATLRETLHDCALLADDQKISAQHVNFLRTKFHTPDKVNRYKDPEVTARLEDEDLPSLLLGNANS